jgi:hypothetical protein
MVWRAIPFVVTAALAVPAPAWAQEEEAVPVEDIKESVEGAEEEEEEPKDGWRVKLRLGGNFNLVDTRNFVGSENGTTVQIGVLIAGSAFFRSGQHRWNNELTIQHNQTLTPQLDRFVKGFDLFDFKSTYIYKLRNPDWLGPFGRFSLQTPLLPFEVVRIDPFIIQDEAGNALSGTVAPGNGFEITGAFEPLQLRQSAGLFGEPVQEQAFNFQFQAGVGVQQIIARDGFSIQDEDDSGDTLLITVREIESVVEVGAEAEVRFEGDIVKDVFYYNFLGNAFWAPYSTTDRDRSDFEDQINLKVRAAIGVVVTKWLEAEYTLNVIRQPQVLDDFQIQNGFQLVLSYNLL